MNEQERLAGLAQGTLPNSYGYREPHVCKFPTETEGLRLGMTWTCPECEKLWKCTTYRPEGPGLATTGWITGTYHDSGQTLRPGQ